MPETATAAELKVTSTRPLTDAEIRYLSQDGWRLVKLSEDRRMAVFTLLNRSLPSHP